MSKLRIGIDVGGTNTDAVLMRGSAVLAALKQPTSADISSGIVSVLQRLLSQADCSAADISAVMIGTTHFTNAVIEGKQLSPTAVIRLGLPATATLPPLVDWPQRLAEVVGKQRFMAHGGYEFDGRLISPLDSAEIKAIASQIADAGIESVAITSVFSPINPAIEQEAAHLIQARLPTAAITLSHEIGQIGLLERENATVLNSCLRALAGRTVAAFEKALAQQAITAPLFISQNDGTLLSAEAVAKFPILTFASGPTNSMRGAAFLSQISDGIVVDIGGTTTDVGVLVNSFPRQAALTFEIGGVRSNFRMPDLYSIGLGGGSLVQQSPLQIGPESVGFRLQEQALVFGGEQLTASDIAVAAGLAHFGDAGRVADLGADFVQAAQAHITNLVASAVDRMKRNSADVPVVLVGGGSVLLGESLIGASDLIRPDHHAVANAVGAGLMQVGGEIDRIVALPSEQRDKLLDQLKQDAVDQAILAGAAAETVTLHSVETIPLAYLPGAATRVRIKAIGDLQL